jgi:hypothetical protein
MCSRGLQDMLTATRVPGLHPEMTDSPFPSLLSHASNLQAGGHRYDFTDTLLSDFRHDVQEWRNE